MTRDITETIDGAVISHGASGSRIYLMKLSSADPVKLIGALRHLAEHQKYAKIFAKIPESTARPFLEAGYEVEASVPGLFYGREQGLFLGYYLNEARKIPADKLALESILADCLKKEITAFSMLPAGISWRTCKHSDAEALAALYREVFPTYPFPIHDPAYILDTMDTHTVYGGLFADGKLAAAASAEMDPDTLSGEMTDFATAVKWRGMGLARHLLYRLESEAAASGILTAYTIARAASPGMNVTFASAGYRYGGLLINNTQISGSVESMNVWYKSLR